ncbi:MAG: response regulator, partial [Planctomycetes bacterium]|nr:response regulator [Planctomycetota bacterium]
SGAEALGLLREAYRAGEAFQVVILDHQMPEMGGEALARAIQTISWSRKPGLVMLSSSAEPLSQAKQKELGLTRCLLKPARPSQLFDSLAAAAGAREEGPPGGESRRSTASPVVAPAFQAAGGAPRTQVLLAEDNGVNQRVARRMLEKLGFEVLVASDGKEAVETYAKTRCGLVLMDCQMPVLDGLAATEEIRRIESDLGVRVPIIALTANAMRGDREKCIEAGMDDYLPKPIRAEDLRRAIERWCGPASPVAPVAPVAPA